MPDVGEEIHEARLPEPLGRRVDEARLPGRDACEARRRLLRGERRVDERRGRRDLRRQLVHLVLHERDERREHERRLGAQHRRELIRERLSRAGRHERERVAACDRGAYDVLLPRPEGVEAEEVAQRCEEIAQAGEYRKRLGWLSADFATTSGPAALGAGELRRRAGARRRARSSQSPAWWVYHVAPRCEAPSGRSSVPAAIRHVLGVGRLQEHARSALAAEATPNVAIAVRALDPAKRIPVDDEVLRLASPRRRRVTTPRRHSTQWQMTMSRIGPRTSYVTAPHRQRPVARGSASPRWHRRIAACRSSPIT